MGTVPIVTAITLTITSAEAAFSNFGMQESSITNNRVQKYLDGCARKFQKCHGDLGRLGLCACASAGGEHGQ